MLSQIELRRSSVDPSSIGRSSVRTQDLYLGGAPFSPRVACGLHAACEAKRSPGGPGRCNERARDIKSKVIVMSSTPGLVRTLTRTQRTIRSRPEAGQPGGGQNRRPTPSRARRLFDCSSPASPIRIPRPLVESSSRRKRNAVAIADSPRGTRSQEHRHPGLPQKIEQREHRGGARVSKDSEVRPARKR